MSIKNRGLRTCLYTNKKFERQALTRLVKVNNTLVVDHNKTMPGRGYWINLTSEALKDPKLISILSKRTKCSVSEDFIKELENEKN